MDNPEPMALIAPQTGTPLDSYFTQAFICGEGGPNIFALFDVTNVVPQLLFSIQFAGLQIQILLLTALRFKQLLLAGVFCHCFTTTEPLRKLSSHESFHKIWNEQSKGVVSTIHIIEQYTGCWWLICGGEKCTFLMLSLMFHRLLLSYWSL